MVERRFLVRLLCHFILLIGVVIMLFPIYVAFIASTHTNTSLIHTPIPLLPGNQFWHNYALVLGKGIQAVGTIPIRDMLLNSFIMALVIAVGKIFVSLLAAFAIVFFRFRCRMILFWLIFVTLMLPVQVRILPSFEIAARLDLLNSFAGLTLPLIASATATFLFRQFFTTIPDELVEAARIDGASPMRFFFDVLIPLSKTNIAALFIIMFIFGWNQFLWPLVITTQAKMTTVVMGIQQLLSIINQIPAWNEIMAMVILATLPPVIIVVIMQKWFIKGLIETEK